jgi:hypothetical protein
MHSLNTNCVAKKKQSGTTQAHLLYLFIQSLFIQPWKLGALRRTRLITPVISGYMYLAFKPFNGYCHIWVLSFHWKRGHNRPKPITHTLTDGYVEWNERGLSFVSDFESPCDKKKNL